MRAVAVLVALVLALPAGAGALEGLSLSGYVQALPVGVRADLPEPLGSTTLWELRVQNRLNVRWDLSPELTFNWQMRTRAFAGDLVRQVPGYADLVAADEGWVDLSWTIAESGSGFVHYLPDRLNLEWMSDDWRVTAGRQRIHWGINTVTNPNDLFNIYSFFEFDYPERPGADAVRVQRFLDWGSRVELAVSPSRERREAVAAGLYAFNTRGYDVQLIAGYFRDRAAVGGGWAGSVGQSGFKGEVMLFRDLDRHEGGGRRADLVAAISGDHMFASGLFLVVEGLYNGAGGREEFPLLGERLSADNPSLSRFQLTAQGSYAFSPVWSGSLAAIWYPDDGGAFVSPSVIYSVVQDLDLSLIVQHFAGGSDSVLADAGTVAVASLKWSF